MFISTAILQYFFCFPSSALHAFSLCDNKNIYCALLHSGTGELKIQCDLQEQFLKVAVHWFG